jgi:6-phosphogluconolactonase
MELLKGAQSHIVVFVADNPMRKLTRRTFMAGISTVPLAARWSFAAGAESQLMFTGTNTDGGSNSKGIYAYRWDSVKGTLSSLGLAAETASPSFLTLSPNRRYLYAVNEINEYHGAATGSVSAFSIDAQSGKLTLKNVASSGGTGPCNITCDQTGRVVAVADYAGGCLTTLRVLPDGSLSEPAFNRHFTGHGANPQRQAAAHVHCVTVSPDNRYLLVNDLGLDRISVYRLDLESGLLTPNDPPFYEAIPGAGPRNFTFHPNHRWAYSLNEIVNSVDALEWDSSRGTLTRLQNISSLPAGFKGETTAAQVTSDSAGRFLYASNRGADTIAVFAIDQAKGTLTKTQDMSCGGKTPRHFALDPSNRWLLAENQDTGNIAIFARNSQTGHLTQTDKQYKIDSPVCAVFV